MLQTMDQGAMEGAMVGACGGSESNRRSDGWIMENRRSDGWIMENRRSDERCKRWIREQWKERWMVQAIDQRAIGGAMGASSD